MKGLSSAQVIDELEVSGSYVHQAFIGTIQKERGSKRNFHFLLVTFSGLRLLHCFQMPRTEEK